MMNRIFLIFTLIAVMLPDFGVVSSFLDTISPQQFVDLVDNGDGTYTAFYEDSEDSDE